MKRRSVLLGLLAVIACNDDGPTEFLGASDVTVQGVLRADTVSIVLDGDACSRLGGLSLWNPDRQAVLRLSPVLVDLEPGTYEMAWNSDPTGFLNVPGAPSLLPVRGVTVITSVSAEEVRGAVDWLVALPPDIDLPPDTTRGALEVRGTFRAARVASGAAC
jgi:hypothetical protein